MDPHQPSRRARQFSCWRGIFAHARYGLVPLILSCTAPAGSAQAATFNVTNTADSGAGSLRQAIFDANAAGGTNTIDVQNGLGTITLTSGDLNALNSNITLNGNGNTLSGNNAFRGLFVYSGTVAINDLTIENAVASGGDAGQAAGGGAGLGGALFVKDGANVTISNLVAQNNAATGGDGGAQTASGVTGGGGGMGGDGGTVVSGTNGGGGGLGSGATGGSNSGNGGDGIAQGEGAGGDGTDSGGGGGTGGNNGGGGGSGDQSVGGGGVNGIDGTFTDDPDGGFGGGGGKAGNGGFGGGGGAFRGDGGFGGGGGGGGLGSVANVGQGGFGAGNGVSSGTISQAAGGGGLGAGGAIFVMDGATLTIAGTLTVNNNTVTGGNGGTGAAGTAEDGSAFGDGVFLQGSGTLTFNPDTGDTQTLANTITDQAGSGGTGSWALTKNGAGTLTLSAANSYSGATNLSAGTLSLSGSGTLGNAAGALNLTGGTLDLGTTTQTRTGTITLNGATVSNGTLSSSGTFDTQSGTISAVLAGTGALTKTGTGTVTLSGANTYSGTTTVSAGRLAVNGSIASAVTVANGATLGGTGTVGATTISSGGIHAPGNSIGTQTVNGAYLLNAGSILEIEVDDAGNSDKVIVNGTVDITGSTLRVKGVSGNNFTGQTTYSYVIIENDGVDAVTGDFATIDNQLAFYDAARSTVGGTGNDVSLTLTRNASGFTDIATTPNQKAVAGQVGNLSGTDGTTISNAILGLTNAGAQHAYQQLSGDIFAAAPTMNARITHQATGQIGARLADLNRSRTIAQTTSGSLVAASTLSPAELTGFARSGPMASDANMLSLGTENAPQSASAIWLQAIGATGRIDGDGNADTTDYQWTGMVGGFDTQLSDTTILGVYFGYADARNRQAGRDATLDSRNFMAGLYGTRDLGDDLRLSGQAGWTRTANDSRRNLVFGGIDRTATADYTDNALNANLELARGFDVAHNWRVAPYGALGMLWNNHDGFTETGAGSANLSRASDSTLTGTASLGLRMAGMFETGNGKTLIPQFRLGWDHHLGPTANSTTLAFTGTSSFTVAGSETDRDTLVGNLGMTLADDDGWSFYADYQPSISKSRREHALGAGFRMKF
ncbi:outer membrane autotransporter barrel domain-containing protein [Thalassospira xiamenensis M-5 = DSM 17429]|uniref:autotransporter outer membrane beta-barrel domain-containing protein n=2 Tax=Thalassospira xiamenensis TaxID=220697 RepID=UPI00095547A1|nr:autotransporter domain-containing protein [Thalassospira xiamenensis]SIT32337.1 outer membrane autotransporter barrel domain-containing protein [Thalassospira xiamenensis M-5 = DSM 17429]